MGNRILWQNQKFRVVVDSSDFPLIEFWGMDSMAGTRWNTFDDQKSCKIPHEFWDTLLGVGLSYEKLKKGAEHLDRNELEFDRDQIQMIQDYLIEQQLSVGLDPDEWGSDILEVIKKLQEKKSNQEDGGKYIKPCDHGVILMNGTGSMQIGCNGICAKCKEDPVLPIPLDDPGPPKYRDGFLLLGCQTCNNLWRVPANLTNPVCHMCGSVLEVPEVGNY